MDRDELADESWWGEYDDWKGESDREGEEEEDDGR